MSRLFRKYPATAGLIISLLVVITGALGYVYITRVNSQVASVNTDSKSRKTSTAPAHLPADSTTPKAIATQDELNALLLELEEIPVDDASADLGEIEAAATSF